VRLESWSNEKQNGLIMIRTRKLPACTVPQLLRAHILIVAIRIEILTKPVEQMETFSSMQSYACYLYSWNQSQSYLKADGRPVCPGVKLPSGPVTNFSFSLKFSLDSCDHRLSAKLVLTFAERACGLRDGFLWPYSRFST
jgi:hypothetical protein